MALYAYRCQSCQTYFQVRKPMANVDNPTECPQCESLETQRLISTVAVFSSAGDRQRRALAGAPSCAGCSVVGTGCASCNPR